MKRLPLSGVITLDDGCAFDSQEHAYTIDDVRIPTVTEIVRGGGLAQSFDAVPEARLEIAAERGDWLHRAIHYWLDDDLDWSTVSPELVPAVEASVRALDEARIEPWLAEQPIVSRALIYGGTPDMFCSLHGEPALLSVKTGAVVHSGEVALQEAGYRELLLDHLSRKLARTANVEIGGWLNRVVLSKTFCLRVDWRAGRARLPRVSEPDEYRASVAFKALLLAHHERTDPIMWRSI